MKKIIFALVILTCFIAACKKEKPGSNEIFMTDSKFNPSSITVSAGTTITWTNKESGAYAATHTVTSDSNIFDSGDMGKDKIFSYTFSTAGTFPYYCKHHSGMKATVIVQ